MYVMPKELNEYYKPKFGKDFPSSTLAKWRRDGKLPFEIIGKRQYKYDLEKFKEIVDSEEYSKKVKATKEKPEDYIGKISGHLQILGIVPKEERTDKYNGTMMYCKCLKCNSGEIIKVKFTYLTPNGNYFQDTCGCNRKERAFLATAREGIREEFLEQFNGDFEYFLYLHKLLKSVTDNYYTNCPIEEYEIAINYLNNNEQFHKVYEFWKSKEKKSETYYDWAKPSIDHIVPKSRGGSNKIENLQILTVFENLNKRDMTWEEWEKFKKETNTKSEYYLESILGGMNNED